MRLNIDTIPTRSDFVATVYKVLLDAIADGSLAPGERITQEEIAEQLHVSRSPVLQALRMLRNDGLIQDAPGRGIQVTPLKPEWVGKLYDVRGALDALAVRLAATAQAHIDPHIIAHGRAMCQSADIVRIIDADIAFHNAIYAASGNELIQEQASKNWVHLRRVMGAVHQWADQSAHSWDGHEAIAHAIQSGNTAQAVLLSDNHIKHAKNNLIQRLSQQLNQDTDKPLAALQSVGPKTDQRHETDL